MNLSNDARFVAESHPKIASDLHRWLTQGHGIVRHLAEMWVARRQRAQELDELYAFTDRDLRDLGLSKSDLPAIERGLYRRE